MPMFTDERLLDYADASREYEEVKMKAIARLQHTRKVYENAVEEFGFDSEYTATCRKRLEQIEDETNYLRMISIGKLIAAREA